MLLQRNQEDIPLVNREKSQIAITTTPEGTVALAMVIASGCISLRCLPRAFGVEHGENGGR